MRKTDEVILKRWTIPILEDDEFNWNFSAIARWQQLGARSEISKAWHVEIDRELGYDVMPFLRQWKINYGEADPEPHRPNALKTVPLDTLVQEILNRLEKTGEKELPQSWGSAMYKRIITMEVDWDFTETEIVESFRTLLRDGAFEIGPERGYPQQNAGRKNDFSAWFKDLAVYRVATAGMNRADGLEYLMPFLRNDISSSHWEHCKTRTQKRIEERFKSLVEHADIRSRLGDPRDWNYYFGILQ